MRQYKFFVLVIQVILANQLLYSGFERTAQPSVLLARGVSGAAQIEFENLWINPASVNSITSFRSTVFYTPSPFQLPQLSNTGVMAGIHREGISIAVGFSSFGFSLYRETTGSLTIGSSAGEGIVAGINCHLYHVAIANYGTAMAGVFDIGTIYSISDRISVGLSLHNVTGADVGEDDDIPRCLLSGVSVTLEERAVVNFDIVKDLRYPVTYRAGFDIALHEYVSIRAGIQGDQNRLFAGFSLMVLPVRIDYGFATHQELGLTHSIGIAIE